MSNLCQASLGYTDFAAGAESPALYFRKAAAAQHVNPIRAVIHTRNEPSPRRHAARACSSPGADR